MSMTTESQRRCWRTDTVNGQRERTPEEAGEKATDQKTEGGVETEVEIQALMLEDCTFSSIHVSSPFS